MEAVLKILDRRSRLLCTRKPCPRTQTYRLNSIHTAHRTNLQISASVHFRIVSTLTDEIPLLFYFVKKLQVICKYGWRNVYPNPNKSGESFAAEVWAGEAARGKRCWACQRFWYKTHILAAAGHCNRLNWLWDKKCIASKVFVVAQCPRFDRQQKTAAKRTWLRFEIFSKLFEQKRHGLKNLLFHPPDLDHDDRLLFWIGQ